MKFLRSFLIGLIAVSLTFGSISLVSAQTLGGRGDLQPGFWKRVSGALLPTTLTDTIGSATTRIAAIYTTLLNVSSIVIGGVVSGNMNVNGTITPSTTNSFDLGSATKYWRHLFATNVSSTAIDATRYVSTTNLLVASTIKLGKTSGFNLGKFYVDSSGNISSSGTSMGLVATTGNRFFTMTQQGDGTALLQASAGMTIGSVLSSAISFQNNVIPASANTKSLGDSSTYWANLFVRNVSSTRGDFLGYVSTTKVIAGVGSAAAPSLTIQGDGDTGIYQYSANNIAISGGGSEKARIGTGGFLVSTTLAPSSNNSINLGTTALNWANLYVSSTIYGKEATFTGNVTSTGIIYTGSMKGVNDPGTGNAVYNFNLAGTYGNPNDMQFQINGQSRFMLYAQSTGVLYGDRNNAAIFAAVSSTRPDYAWHNKITLGAAGAAWSNIYASSTAYLANISAVNSASVTTTLQVGSSVKATCLVLGDIDKAGITYCTALNGTLTCSTDNCNP